ncbi:hypothetical protein [Specibacter cremeus]|uniref:hypothetical protein n=1 Tax=Specibacter cremeus TaxID=1629051 RepID=UPI000F79B68C|nr:hypothetical protein [Specibacter cremeus]
MDDHWIVARNVENPDFQQGSFFGRSYEHGKFLVHGDPAYREANSMPDVRFGNAMLPRGAPIRI